MRRDDPREDNSPPGDVQPGSQAPVKP